MRIKQSDHEEPEVLFDDSAMTQNVMRYLGGAPA